MSEAVVNKAQVSSARCSHCGAVLSGEHFCETCDRIQPVAEHTDFFAFIGLPRRLRLDETELEKTFYALSRQFHPDYFMAASEAERQASMERSSMLNDAYRTLRDRVARAEYLLSLEGYTEAEKKAPPDLLEEVFELNMQVEELKAAKKMADDDEIAEAVASLETALAGLRTKLAEIDERLFAQFEQWDSVLENNTASGEKRIVLDRMSELLSHRSYIRNLVRDITEVI
ncbi:MAG TPA: Fe-S protein assembly co-chaperone HscB [Blastocatellia bacterium]|nr:Fe-S protein assembly co-chaperone HscB [Blastocatellia bacterium]